MPGLGVGPRTSGGRGHDARMASSTPPDLARMICDSLAPNRAPSASATFPAQGVVARSA
jgi:hypothetical protein